MILNKSLNKIKRPTIVVVIENRNKSYNIVVHLAVVTRTIEVVRTMSLKSSTKLVREINHLNNLGVVFSLKVFRDHIGGQETKRRKLNF